MNAGGIRPPGWPGRRLGRDAARSASRLLPAVDAGIGAFNSGKAFAAETLQNVVRLVSSRAPHRT